MSHNNVKFDEALDKNDYGLIVCGKTGRLKGLWIPIESEDTPVPESIIELCISVFGIDPKEFDDNNNEQTVH